MRIILPEHVIGEFKQVLDTARTDAGALEEALAKGESAEALRQFASGVLPVWLSHAGEDGRAISYDQFLRRATDMVARLRTLPNVETITFNAGRDRALTQDAADCARALEEELHERQRWSDRPEWERPRGERAVEEDGKTMAILWENRRTHRGSSWPGGWVMTRDTHMGPAFNRVV